MRLQWPQPTEHLPLAMSTTAPWADFVKYPTEEQLILFSRWGHAYPWILIKLNVMEIAKNCVVKYFLLNVKLDTSFGGNYLSN